MQETDSQSGAAERRTGETPCLGARLRSERKRQNLSREQIAEELRLEPRVLQALEDERFEDLVAPVFARGYLRQYGKKLGLDCDGLLRDYDRLTEHSDIEVPPPQSVAVRSMEPQLSHRWMLAALIVMLVAAVGAGAVWWFGGVAGFAERFGLASSSTNPAALPYTTPSADETEPEEALLRTDARGARPAAAVERQAVGPSLAEFIFGRAPDRSDSADPADVSRPFDPGDPAELADPAGSLDPAEPAGLAGRADAATPAAPSDGIDSGVAASPVISADDLSGYATVEAALTFVEDSWAEVTDARGVRLVYDLGTAGEQQTVVGAAPVDFLFGNAGGVLLAIDGEPYFIPRSDSPGTVVGFTVEASGD